jgi:hypothetical protein
MKTSTTKGRVTSIDDPAKAGRVKVAIQEMDGNEYATWVRPSLTPGWVAMPEVGQTVELEMPEGDDIVEFSDEVRYKGRILDGANPVPEDFRDNYPKRRGFRSPAGHFLLFDDDDGIVLTVGASGSSNIGVTIDAKTGSVQIFGTTSVQLTAIGAVTINGASCTILGRPVIPGGGPI